MTIPESGIEQGRAFGYGSNIYLGDQWETTESNFWLHHEKGDALFLYCKSEGIVNVLSALSTSGGFEPSGWEFYLEHQSALPDALEGNYGVVVLQDHLDSYIYNGPSYIRNDDYQKALMNPENWMGEEYKPSPSPPPSLFPTATLPASSATANTAINSGTMVAMTILRFFF